jgi:catechol 2,3-dioxygenase-like lactoylglutathione lyase family enzyme
MELSIQAALLNVTDLQRSIEFYRDVFNLRVVSQGDRVAALMIDEKYRRQVLMLRELGRNARRGGRGNIGVRLLSFEAGSLDELDAIEQRLVERQALVWERLRTRGYTAIIGVDPDRIEIAVASSNVVGTPIRSDDWKELDDMIYAIE